MGMVCLAATEECSPAPEGKEADKFGHAWEMGRRALDRSLAILMQWLRGSRGAAPSSAPSHALHTLLMMFSACLVVDDPKEDARGWYAVLARFLVSRQLPDGSWPAFADDEELDASHGPAIRTCLALLCLRRGPPAKTGARAPVTGSGK
jgi:hypothetical protein